MSFPLFVPIIAGITVGALFGFFNGVLVAYGKLPPFIATLGTMVIARGAYTQAAIVSSLTAPYRAIAQTLFFPFRFPVLGVYVIIITIVVWIIMRHTRQGSNFYAIGGNINAARVSVINVERNLVSVYLFAGILYGADGLGIPALLEGILALINLDGMVRNPVVMMDAVKGDSLDPAVEKSYREVIDRLWPGTPPTERIERFAFYERAKSAYCVVMTGETVKYGNIIFKKGVIPVK